MCNATPHSSAERVPLGVLGVLLLTCCTYSMAQTLIVPALPAISIAVGAAPEEASWLVTGFLLAASVSTPIVGRLGDVYGKGRALAGVMIIFSIGELVCAFADSIGLLIVGRTLQGIAAGVFPLAFGIVRDTFPAARVPVGLAVVSSLFGAGAGLGVALAAPLVEHGGIAALFLSGAFAGVACGVAAVRLVPHSRLRSRVSVDWFGALLLGLSLATILLAVSQGNRWGWGSVPTLGMSVLGLALTRAWVAFEARRPQPLIDLALLRRRSIAATNLASACNGFAMFSFYFLLPLLAHEPRGHGLSISQAALVILPTTMSQFVIGPTSGWIGPRIGFRTTLAIGSTCCGGGLAWLAARNGHSSDVVLSGVLVGAGVAFVLAATANLIVAGVPQSDVGVAGGINNVARTVGGAFGVAATTAALAAGGSGTPGTNNYTFAFALAAGVACLGAIAAFVVPRHRNASLAIEQAAIETAPAYKTT